MITSQDFFEGFLSPELWNIPFRILSIFVICQDDCIYVYIYNTLFKKGRTIITWQMYMVVKLEIIKIHVEGRKYANMIFLLVMCDWLLKISLWTCWKQRWKGKQNTTTFFLLVSFIVRYNLPTKNCTYIKCYNTRIFVKCIYTCKSIFLSKYRI